MVTDEKISSSSLAFENKNTSNKMLVASEMGSGLRRVAFKYLAQKGNSSSAFENKIASKHNVSLKEIEK